MTSATEELRRLLDERGVEYETDERNAITEWSTYYGAFVFFARQREGKLLVETTVATKHSVILTPEQAIAATLGQGTLTAEDVRSFLNRNSVFDDTTWPHGRQELVFDEDDLQAMADELNATLGCGTCKDVGIPGDFACSACGARMFTENNDGHTMCLADKMTIIESPNYCPNCGAKVVS